ncbi:MAG: PAS domain S-box protein [Pseudomonadota bacterium]|nr:PAS domain S-box protein [Pseudomonadota bacterium]
MSLDRSHDESALLDAINAGLIGLDRAGRIERWNAWMTSASGHSLAAIRGKLLTEIFPAAEHTRLHAAVTAALSSNASTILSHSINPSRLPLQTRSGRILIHDITVSPVIGGVDVACIILVNDVTMAARRESYLRDRQDARYNAVVGSASDVIMTIYSDGLIQLANPAAVSQFGFGIDELVGRDAATLFASDSNWSTMWQAATEGAISPQPRELTAIRKDGSLSYLEGSASRWTIGSHAFVTVILRDINQRKATDLALRSSEEAARTAAAALADLNQTLEQRVEERTAQLMKAEQALRQSQKMEAIGQLTGGIAHDFNNLLQGISGALHVVQKRISAGRIGDVDRFITGALESANRAASLTHRLLAFARQQPVDPRPLDENELISSVEELLRRTIGETLQLKFVPGADLWLVRCDANQLENAILNLAINARDAMLGGGTLSIETSNQVLDAAAAKVRDVRPGDYVRLLVTDTGTGMSPEVQARIFDPFFTTKAIGKGTGLGLSMVYGFVRQSDGSIKVDSEVGRGTSFEICLPRFRGELEAESTIEVSRKDKRAGSDEVVLVVEDESIVRLLVVDVLQDLGYHALEANSGTSALRILQSNQRIDLLIADLGLPDINGRQLADAGMAKRSGLKVLFMTGYAEQAAHGSFLEGGMEIITKPFNMDALASRIRELIERA